MRALVGHLVLMLVAGCAASSPAAAPAHTGERPPLEEVRSLTLLTHCGIEWAVVEGRTWRAVQPRPEPADLPGPDNVVTEDNVTRGTWTVLGPDLARFDVTDPLAAPVPGGVDFRPATGPRPPCD